ncbi:PHP domain-containing protein [Herbivorax sp. ANBcel31]|uniref:PHP domain-containing protein n=1 Tax=Herbivorax sp. ANBcel31 TaxID=3069754 RepID=UPI0027AFDF99|nr:PHP domain-containing protein [Herbivorax sp. ANBcel31]MDQ2086743.1 PHP domain-containing protein [Herbivorax sp. ANBcel31]
MKADLHCHSYVSDGSLSTKQLVKLAERVGINALAISDHDTVEGFKEAAIECEKHNILNIPAIEISAYDYKRDKKVHILGYLLDRPEELGNFCRPMVEERIKNSKWMVSELIKKGFPLSWDFVSGFAYKKKNVYKQHIMRALMEIGYSSSIKGELYNWLFSKPKEKSAGGILYKEINYVDAFEAVREIKKSGGLAVLAHPAGYKNIDIIPELIDVGLDGVEAFHPSHTKAETNQLIMISGKYDLIMTGGSDFHGMYEGHTSPMGLTVVGEDSVNSLFRRKEKAA